MLLRDELQQTQKLLCKYGFLVGEGKGVILSHLLVTPFILLNFLSIPHFLNNSQYKNTELYGKG